MPTFENPAADADEVQTALRALAHATRSIDDPRQIYSVLGSLTSAVASLSQSLHQLAAFHDGAGGKTDVGGRRLPRRHARRRIRCRGISTAPARCCTRSPRPSRTPTRPRPRITYAPRVPRASRLPAPVRRPRAVAVKGWNEGRLHSAVLVVSST